MIQQVLSVVYEEKCTCGKTYIGEKAKRYLNYEHCDIGKIGKAL